MCAHLLGFLKTYDGKSFRTTERHSRITACTLPEWLPADIIEKMVLEFGGILRGELVKLRNLTQVLRLGNHRRTSSNDTRRISMDSTKSGPVDHDDMKQHIKIALAQNQKPEGSG